MIRENELIALLLNLGLLIFVLQNRSGLAALPRFRIHFAAFYLILAGRFLTVLEDIFLPAAVNLLEHICYVTSAVLLAVWAWRTFRKEAPE